MDALNVSESSSLKVKITTYICELYFEIYCLIFPSVSIRGAIEFNPMRGDSKHDLNQYDVT